MKVDIYLETDKQCQACIQRKYGYVIEIMHHGQLLTREGFGDGVSTYHQCRNGLLFHPVPDEIHCR